MASLRSEFHANFITTAINEIFYQRSNLYYFLGKIDPWSVDSSPDAEPSNTSANDLEIRNNIAYMRKVVPGDTSLIAPGYEWQSGTIFAKWDNTLDMTGQPFYVVTDEFNVYKCLDNNNSAASTVKPTSNSTAPILTGDGYLWKYMYNIPSFKRPKFLSADKLPVQQALSDSFYSNGAVEGVVVVNSGSGYQDTLATTITVSGGTTTGSNGQAYVNSVDGNGAITSIGFNNTGSGYTAGFKLNITTTAGVNADIEFTETAGVLTGYTINDGGLGYLQGDLIDFVVGGASFIPVIDASGGIIDVLITNSGAGYTVAPTLTVVGTGSGKYGNASALLEAIIYNGAVVEVSVLDRGQGYVRGTNTTIQTTGDGSGAVFSPIVFNGELVGVVVDNSGSGYTYMNMTVNSTTGDGAVITPILSSSDFVSDQSIVEQTTVPGAIYSITVDEGGQGYTSTTVVTIEGDGTGATAVAVVSGNTITRINMVTYGSGYTYANAVITDINRNTTGSPTDAAAHCILPPIGGHGFNAVRELYADTIAIYSPIIEDTELALLGQDFRQYGLIVDPRNISTNVKSTLESEVIAFEIEFNANVEGLLNPDVILVNNNNRYRVISVTGSNVKLQRLSYVYTIPAGIMTIENTQTQFTINSVVSLPTINKYSGNLLYVSYQRPFQPAEDQTIAIRTYITL